MNNTPTWSHRPANIDKSLVPLYQKEMLKYLKVKAGITDFLNLPSQFRLVGSCEDIKNHCPVAMSILKSLGIDHLLVTVGIIVVNSEYHYPIHIDSANPARQSIGLNIPVLNCADSYTAFYKVSRIEYEKWPPRYLVGSEMAAGSVMCAEEDAVEIARCDANVPHWINVQVPHKPICNHNKLRINSSFRFEHTINEIINSDYFEEKLVNHD